MIGILYDVSQIVFFSWVGIEIVSTNMSQFVISQKYIQLPKYGVKVFVSEKISHLP